MTMKLTFVGSGVSCAVPVIGHVDTQQQQSAPTNEASSSMNKAALCCCEDAFRNPFSKNKRNNVSILIELPIPREAARERHPDVGHHGSDIKDDDDDDPIRILIDCGKTFRDAYQRVLAPKGVSYMDVLLLTHGHADAMHSTQELCDMQSEADARRPPLLDRHKGCPNAFDRLKCLRAVPTFLTLPTLREVEAIAPSLASHSEVGAYIADRQHSVSQVESEEAEEERYLRAHAQHKQSGSACAHGPTERPRTVLDIYLVPEDRPVGLHPHMAVLQHYLAAKGSTAAGKEAFPFPVYTLPVEHGKDYISLGFVFGSGTAFAGATAAEGSAARGACVVYLSDISAIPPASLHFLRQLQRIDLLIIDLLAGKGTQSPPHYCWDDVMPVVRLLAPKKVYGVGMYCSLEYATANAEWEADLQEEKARVRAALVQSGGPIPPLHLSGTSATEEMEWTLEEQRYRAERFVAVTESIELAYDGLELELPM